MKRRIIALLMLAAVMTALLAGCAKEQDPVQEPDAAERTQSHAIGRHQKIIYSFHLKKTAPDQGGRLVLFLLSNNKKDPLKSDNRCTVEIGAEGTGAFQAHSTLDFFSSSSRWRTDKNASGWTMETPYAAWADIAEADVTVTFARSGKALRVSADIDGEPAWQGEAGIKHLWNKEIYLYLACENYALTGIRYQDLGSARFLSPSARETFRSFGNVILVLLGIALIFGLHVLAKIGEVGLYDADSPIFCSLISSGMTVGIIGMGLMVLGRTHPDLLDLLSFHYISVPMPAGGTWFWVPMAIFALFAIGFGIAVGNMAIGLHSIPLRLLAAFGLGVLHTLWYYLVANFIIQSMKTIVALILFLIFGAAMAVISNNFAFKSYNVYSNRGYEGTITVIDAADSEDQKKK